MSRTARYTLGTRIENHFLDLLEIIYQSYYAPTDKKIEKIVTAINTTDLLKYLLQIAWENKLLKDSPYAELSAKILEIGKMLGGWKNNIAAKISPGKQNSSTK